MRPFSAQLFQFTDTLSEPILSLDREGSILHANDSARKIFCFSLNEMKGKSFFSNVCDSEHAVLADKLSRCDKGLLATPHVFTFLTAQGTVRATASFSAISEGNDCLINISLNPSVVNLRSEERLCDLWSILLNSFSIEETAENFLTELISLLSFEEGAIYITEADSPDFKLLFSTNCDLGVLEQCSPIERSSFENNSVMRSLLKGNSLVLKKPSFGIIAEPFMSAFMKGEIGTAAFQPLRESSEIEGFMLLFGASDSSISDEESMYMERAASAFHSFLENSRKYRKSESARAKNETLLRMMSIVLNSDDYPSVIKETLHLLLEIEGVDAVALNTAPFSENVIRQGVGKESCLRKLFDLSEKQDLLKEVCDSICRREYVLSLEDRPEHGAMLSHMFIPIMSGKPTEETLHGVLGLSVSSRNKRTEDSVKSFLRDASDIVRSIVTDFESKLNTNANLSELEKANDRLSELTRSREEFFSVISHELKNPLALIKGYAETLKSSFETLDRKITDAAASAISAESERMSKVIDDLLDTSLAYDRKLIMEKVPVDMKQEVYNICSAYRQRESDAAIEIKLPPENVIAEVDKSRFRQIMGNLMDNAIKYSPENIQITIDLSVINESVLISVTDNGIGLTEAEKEQAFEKFYRSSRPESRAVKGSGLGLYVVKNLIDAHGGSISIDSETNKGTRIDFTIPIKEKEETLF